MIAVATKQISVSEQEISKLAEQFETSHLEEVLEWAADRFGLRLVMTSNFGAEGVVLMDHLARVAPRTPVVYLSTGFQFKATDDLKERLRERYELNIVEAKADLSVEEQTAIHGERLYEDVRVPSKAQSPFAVVTTRQEEIVQWLTAAEYIGKQRTRAEIVSVRVYPQGRGEWFDFADSYHALREALTGISCLPVNFGAEEIGIVFQSRFLREVKRSHSEGDFEVLHHGIAIDVIHL